MRDTFNRVSFGYGARRWFRNLATALMLTSSAAMAETVTIAALGDSLTAGYGLPTEDGFVPQLQSWLDAQGADVRIINAGVSGDTTAGGFSRAAWTMTPEVDGVILALGSNDYLRGLPPEVSFENVEGIIKTAHAQDVSVLLVGLNVGNNYGPDYKAEMDAIYPTLADTYDLPLFPSWFAGLLAVAGMQEGLTQFLQSDGLHPNAEGVRIIVAAMGPTILEFVDGLE